MVNFNVHGTCAAGFERVREQFEHHFSLGSEQNAQLCVYFDGKVVVDLWGMVVGGEKVKGKEFGPDSIMPAFSSGKTVMSLVIAKMVDLGHLSYDDLVVKHWPEFGKHEKESIRIKDILKHESGLGFISHSFEYKELWEESIKRNVVGKLFENETCKYTPQQIGEKRRYAPFTTGLVMNEIVRRAHPEGKTIGEILEEDISRPLEADFFIGLNEERAKQSFPLTAPGIFEVYLRTFIPRWMYSNPNDVRLVLYQEMHLAHYVLTLGMDSYHRAPPFFTTWNGNSMPQLTEICNDPDLLRGQAPGFNGCGSARGLAKLGTCLVNKGELNGTKVIAEETFKKLHANFTKKEDECMMNFKSNFNDGGLFLSRPKEVEGTSRAPDHYNDGFIGFGGYGGSMFMYNCAKKMSFAYMPTNIAWYDSNCRRALALRSVIMDCISDLSQ